MKKSTNKLSVSLFGSLIVLGIIVLANAIFSTVNIRLDMTENKAYTLTDNTKRILSKLDTPVAIKFYYSKSNTHMPVGLKNYAQRVEDLLNEYKQAANGNIEVVKHDPQPDSDAEDSALMDGVQGQLTNTGDKIYLGIAITVIDETVALPALSPQRETLLEYDITRALTRITRTKKPVIGIMSALPVMGQQPTPQMMQMGMFQRTPGWRVIQELQRDFDVREVQLTADVIPADMDVLIAIHPSGISDATQYALDQFVLRGGKLIAYLDPSSYVGMSQAQQNRQMAALQSSNMPSLLKAWGVEFSGTNAVADMEYARRIRGPQGEINHAAVLDLTANAVNKDDVLTSQLNTMTMVFAGGFTGTPIEGLSKDILISSTENSATIAANMVNNPQMAFRNFNADSKVYDLAIRLSGKFKTAFPDGKPGAEKKEGDAKDDGLKEATKESVVVLVGDSDMLFDQICVQTQSILGQQLAIPLNDNLNFAQGVAESLAGDSDLIGIRSRQAVRRPFTEVKKMQAQAELKFRSRILELEQELQTAQQRINQLQSQKSADQRFVMSPEQQAELKKFAQTQAKTNKELKHLRRQLRKDINSLENNIKFANIALIPILIVIAGIIIAVRRKKRSAAR